MGGQDFSPCLVAASFVVDRPPTYFIVTKKFIPAGGATVTTHPLSVSINAWKREIYAKAIMNVKKKTAFPGKCK